MQRKAVTPVTWLHHKDWTLEDFYTRSFWSAWFFTRSPFAPPTLLHEETKAFCTRNLFHQKHSTPAFISPHKALIPEDFTPEALTPHAFTPQALHASSLLHQKPFTPEAFSKQKALTSSFTPEAISRKFLHQKHIAPQAYSSCICIQNNCNLCCLLMLLL